MPRQNHDPNSKDGAYVEAAAIRRGEREGQLPDYEVLTGWLQRVPLTWLPDLFFRICLACIMRGVFQEGGMDRMITRAQQQASDPDGSALR
jgi:hypothetical protein